MNRLLAEGDRDGVVEALFRSVEDMSDEDLDALRRAPSWLGRVAAAHTVTREILGETRARLDAEQAAKISVPVLLVIGEKSTDPARREVGAVAAALPDSRLLVLAGLEHIADILGPEHSRSTCWSSCTARCRAPVDCLLGRSSPAGWRSGDTGGRLL